jgi:hypothetical protein
MEADISIWRKTGHFYFALTEISDQRSLTLDLQLLDLQLLQLRVS